MSAVVKTTTYIPPAVDPDLGKALAHFPELSAKQRKLFDPEHRLARKFILEVLKKLNLGSVDALKERYGSAFFSLSHRASYLDLKQTAALVKELGLDPALASFAVCPTQREPYFAALERSSIKVSLSKIDQLLEEAKQEIVAYRPDLLRAYRHELALAGRHEIRKREQSSRAMPEGVSKIDKLIRSIWLKERRLENPTASIAEIFYPLVRTGSPVTLVVQAEASLSPKRAIELFKVRPQQELPYGYFFIAKSKKEQFLAEYKATTGENYPLAESKKLQLKAEGLFKERREKKQAEQTTDPSKLNRLARLLVISQELDPRGLFSTYSFKNILAKGNELTLARYRKVTRAIEKESLPCTLETAYFLLARSKRRLFKEFLGNRGLKLDQAVISGVWAKATEYLKLGKTPELGSNLLKLPDAKTQLVMRHLFATLLIRELRISSQKSLGALMDLSETEIARKLKDNAGLTHGVSPQKMLRFLQTISNIVAFESIVSFCAQSRIAECIDRLRLEAQKDFNLEKFNAAVESAKVTNLKTAKTEYQAALSRYAVPLHLIFLRKQAAEKIISVIGQELFDQLLARGLKGLKPERILNGLVSMAPEAAAKIALDHQEVKPELWGLLCAPREWDKYSSILAAAGIQVSISLPPGKYRPAALSQDLSFLLNKDQLKLLRTKWFRQAAQTLGISPVPSILAPALGVATTSLRAVFSGIQGFRVEKVLSILEEHPGLDRETAGCLVNARKLARLDLELKRLYGLSTNAQKLNQLVEAAQSSTEDNFEQPKGAENPSFGITSFRLELRKIRRLWLQQAAQTLGIPFRHKTVASVFEVGVSALRCISNGIFGFNPNQLIRILEKYPNLDRETASCLVAQSKVEELDYELAKRFGIKTNFEKLTTLKEQALEAKVDFEGTRPGNTALRTNRVRKLIVVEQRSPLFDLGLTEGDLLQMRKVWLSRAAQKLLGSSDFITLPKAIHFYQSDLASTRSALYGISIEEMLETLEKNHKLDRATAVCMIALPKSRLFDLALKGLFGQGSDKEMLARLRDEARGV